MFERFFNLNWAAFWSFLTGPVLAALIWFVLDYCLRKLYLKSVRLDSFFKNRIKLKPLRRVILILLRVLLGIYFAFIILDHFNVGSRPILNISVDGLWRVMTGPVLTLAIWAGLDVIIRLVYEKSAFIERIFPRYARVRTFKQLLLQACRVLLGIYFAYRLLGFFSIDPRPLLAGIGVVGLGISLAAQNILRDFLNGLFIIIEDQFNVGDVVTIGDFSGTVESFTMRVTRLRTIDGKLVIIPNSSIIQIVNSTKDFAVAVVDVNVGYGEDAKAVMEMMEDCALKVRRMMHGVVVDAPKVFGILAFRENDFQVRVSVKTMPGEQWAVERALRFTIKEKLDEQGIRIPVKQIVIHTDTRGEKKETPPEGEAS